MFRLAAQILFFGISTIPLQAESDSSQISMWCQIWLKLDLGTWRKIALVSDWTLLFRKLLLLLCMKWIALHRSCKTSTDTCTICQQAITPLIARINWLDIIWIVGRSHHGCDADRGVWECALCRYNTVGGILKMV